MAALNGPDKTGEFFTGVKWTLQAHYPRLTDYVEESHDSRETLLASIQKHNKAGANVQTHTHKWEEVHVALGWYPSGRARRPR